MCLYSRLSVSSTIPEQIYLINIFYVLTYFMLLNNLMIIEQSKEFKMRYILKMGVDFAFEADSPAEFLKLWPRGRRTAYQDTVSNAVVIGRKP